MQLSQFVRYCRFNVSWASSSHLPLDALDGQRASSPISPSTPDETSSLRFVPIDVQSSRPHLKRVSFSSPTHGNNAPEPHACISEAPSTFEESISSSSKCDPHLSISPASLNSASNPIGYQVYHFEAPKDTSSGISAANEPATKKSLRVLSSFLGGFMETVRSATQLSTSTRTSGKRRRKRSKQTLTHAPQAPPQTQGLRSLRSFDFTRTTSADAQSQIQCSNLPWLKRSLTDYSQLNMKTTNGPPRALNHCSPQGYSPVTPLRTSLSIVLPPEIVQLPITPLNSSARLEILSALQPPRTQVILSSSPLESHKNA